MVRTANEMCLEGAKKTRAPPPGMLTEGITVYTGIYRGVRQGLRTLPTQTFWRRFSFRTHRMLASLGGIVDTESVVLARKALEENTRRRRLFLWKAVSRSTRTSKGFNGKYCPCASAAPSLCPCYTKRSAAFSRPQGNVLLMVALSNYIAGQDQHG